MHNKIGVWIDHKKAVIVSVSPEAVTTVSTVESEIGPHARYSGRSEYPTPDGPKEGGGERHYERRYDQHLGRYYDEIISRLGQSDALLIFGPGEAKLQFKERLAHTTAPAERAIDIETTDKLTDPQIVAQVKAHYGLDHPHA
jgi:hypothetical protein